MTFKQAKQYVLRWEVMLLMVALLSYAYSHVWRHLFAIHELLSRPFAKQNPCEWRF